MWEFTTPRTIVFGEDALEYLKEVEGKRALIVTDKVINKLGYVDKVAKYLKEAGMKINVFDEVEPEPSVETILKGAEFACPQKPVRGDLATTVYLPVLGDGVPVKGPVMNISLFSGPKGSIPFLTSSKRYLVASPLPPKNFLRVLVSGNSSVILDVDKLTLKIFPMYPNIFSTPEKQNVAKTMYY